MFDWNDEELTNIWDEAGESDDHIVPYTDKIEGKPPILYGDPTKKEINQGGANVGSVEQKKPTIKSEHGVELDGSSNYDHGDSRTVFDLDSWPAELDPSLSDAAKDDSELIGTATLDTITKNSENGSLTDKTLQFNKDSEIFQNPSEDREQGDFVDYSWANIGSFDDLDRIFSGNDPVFGDISVDSTNELWPSSKDLTSSPLGSSHLPGDSSDLALEPLRTSSDGADTKSEYMQSFITEHEKVSEITSLSPEAVQIAAAGGKIQEYHRTLGDGTAASISNKGNRQKRCLKGQKLDKRSAVRPLHDAYGTWSPSASSFQQIHNQYPPSMVNSCPPFVLTPQKQIQRPPPLQLNHFPGPMLASPSYGIPLNHYPAPSVLTGYDVPPGNTNYSKKSVDASVKTSPMTPKEKIEKLRRRQQMRAMLAIQKQQQQFGNQMAVADDESLCSFPSIDPNSPCEHDDDSGTGNLAVDNCTGEESVLYHLLDVISKMDISIRLSIRDSLFRLAQSAMQRQYPSDTSSTNTSTIEEILQNKDIGDHERFAKMPEVEKHTNLIDRTVAHLLFHRPIDPSGKPTDMIDSPASSSLGRKATSSKSTATGFLPDGSEDTQMLISPQGSKTLGPFDGNQFKNMHCLDNTYDNASNNDAAADGGSTK